MGVGLEIVCNDYNRLGLGDRKLVGLITCRNRAGIFCWVFCDKTGYDVGVTCVGLVVGGIINVSGIYDMQLNYSSPVSCKE